MIIFDTSFSIFFFFFNEFKKKNQRTLHFYLKMASQPIVKSLNHVGIIVPDVDKACEFYEKTFGIKCTEPQDLVPSLKIRFGELGNARLEFIEPLTEDSDHAKFLKDHPKGGIHHISFNTEDVEKSTKELGEAGVRTLDPVPLVLTDGVKIQFFNPEDTFGVLTELTPA
jgi:methylmalonyl-CoA/ethylmalonyl-CoA epimerase